MGEKATMELRIKKLFPTATLPTRAKPNDSGLDLRAHMPQQEWAIIPPGGVMRFWTGIAIELPPPMHVLTTVGDVESYGYEAQIRSRSGLTNQGVVACGGLGTVDNGYRGELGVTLLNHSFREFKVRHGDRIAQLVVCPVAYPVVVEVESLSETERGADGFGSTGV